MIQGGVRADLAAARGRINVCRRRPSHGHIGVDLRNANKGGGLVMRIARMSSCAAALLLAGTVSCSTETVTPPVQEVTITEFEPTLGAMAGQASLPGLMMGPGFDLAGATAGCQWDATVSRVVCAPVTRNGLTIRRSFVFLDANGAPHARRDETTVASNTRVAVAGTVVGPRGSITVDRASTLTVSGLRPGSATHTLDGEESGTTSGTHSTDRGTVRSTETFHATTENVVVPVPRSPGAWPLSGTSTRRSTVTASREGSSETRTRAFSQQVTFNGTRYVPVTLTLDGTTRQCTLDLAVHRTDCGR